METYKQSSSDVSSQNREQQLGKSAALISVLVIISRITGFIRTWAQAYALGATVIASCYSVANNLPNQLYELVIGGMLVTAFLPVYLSVKKKSGIHQASEYASNLTSLVVILMTAVTVIGFIFAGQVVYTQSFSARSDFDTALAVYFFKFFVIEVLLYALSSIFSGILNAERDYFWSSAAPIFNNFVTIASFLAYAFLVNSYPVAALIILALGNPLGVLIQVVLQIPSLIKQGIRLRFHVDLKDPALKDTLSIGIPSLVVMVGSFVTVSVQTSSALSVCAEGASIAFYARLWYTLPYAILAVPITTAMFTELSYDIAKHDMKSYCAGIQTGTQKILFLMIPFSLFLIMYALPLVHLMAAGKFNPQQLQDTALYLAGLAVSLPAYGVCMYLQKICSSLRTMKYYAFSALVASLIQVAFCIYLTPLFGLCMVALSSSVMFVVVDILTFIMLFARLHELSLLSFVLSCFRAFICGLAGAVVGGFIFWLSGHGALLYDSSLTVSLASVLGMLILSGVPALVVTFGFAWVFHMPEIDFIRSLVHKKQL